jgi:hypothetical protein
MTSGDSRSRVSCSGVYRIPIMASQVYLHADCYDIMRTEFEVGRTRSATL